MFAHSPRYFPLVVIVTISALFFSCATGRKDSTDPVADDKNETVATDERLTTVDAVPPPPPPAPADKPASPRSLATEDEAQPLEFKVNRAEVDRSAQGQLQGVGSSVGQGSIPSTTAVGRSRGPLGAGKGYLRREEPKTNDRIAMDSTSVDEGGSDTYDLITENDFLASVKNPLSTFSIDVDAASYSNVRRYIKGGQLPPKDAVRIEELINYFHYDYPKPAGADPFSITTESAACPWAPDHRLVGIGLQGRTFDMSELPPNNLVFLIDVSGSMDEPDKLPLLKSSLRLLVGQLRKEDKVSIVVYAGAAGEVLPATSGADRMKILEAIDNLSAGGSTAGGAGIQLAYATALANFKKTGNNRVILATDGDFNVGMSSDAELIRLIEKKRESGVYLTVLGFGRGNLKDSRMEQLADKGNGHYAYIDDMSEARKVFGNEIGGTLFTIAKDVKIQVEFNPARVQGYRLIGYENRALRSEDFNDDRKDAGDLGAGHMVTALYEIIPVGAPESAIRFKPVDSLKYQTSRVVTPSTIDELMTVKLRYKHPNDTASKLIVMPVRESGKAFAAASENLRFSAAVAGWGMLLRDSQYKGSATFDEIAKIARGAVGTDQLGYRKELVSLVEASAVLSKTASR